MDDTSLLSHYGPAALLTGAASGIGAAFARRLARAGFVLVLVDRDAAGLEAVRAAVRAEAADVVTLAGDLTDASFVDSVIARANAADVGLMVHSAGITSMGELLDLDLEPQIRCVDLHCQAALRLVHGLGRPMRTRGRGGLVLLSSNSAILRAPYVATYAATKAFALALAEALYEELRPDGVDVLALVPGMTDTPMFAAARPEKSRLGKLVQPPEAVVEGALAALGKQPVYISSAPDRFAASVMGAVMPRKLSLAAARRSMEYFFPHLARSNRR